MKRLLTVLIVVALAVPTLGLSAAAQTTVRNSCPSDIPRAGYTDVDANGTHAFDIDCIVWRGITDRVGTFGPADALPRWEMAQWIWGSLSWIQYVTVENEATFTDIAGLSPEIQDAIEFVRQADVTKGIGNDLYDPYGAVPRWQMALFLTRMVEAAGLPLPGGAPQGFVDIGGATTEAQLAINQLAELGITRGTSETTFSPDQVVTREQMASFIARTLEQTWVLFPFPTECNTTVDPAECTGVRTEAIPSTPLRVRTAIWGVEGFLTIEGVVSLLEDPGTTTEVYIDGVRQIVTKSIVARSKIAYAFHEFTLPAGTNGTFTIEVQTFVSGQLLESDVIEMTFN